MTKVLVLNQATFDPDYLTVDALSRSTWSFRTHPDVHTIHYYGAKDARGNPFAGFKHIPTQDACVTYSQTLSESNNEIMVCDTYDVLNTSEHADPRNVKLILAYEYAVNNYEFDFIVRVCNTTYVDIPKMHRFFDNYPRKTRVYNGARNLYNYDYYFVSGFGNYMSRDVAEELVRHKKEFLELKDPFNIEDVAVGYMVMHQLECAENGKDGYVDSDIINHALPRDYIEEFTIDHYDPDDDIFMYRFGLSTLNIEKYIQLHNKLIKN
jgi:hypothetical protein